MEITTHGLKKPASDDFYNIQDHNDNTDIIEEHISDFKTHVDQIATSSNSGHIKIGTGFALNNGVASVKLTDSVNLDDSETALTAKAGKQLSDSLKLDVKDVIMIGDSYASTGTQNPNWTDFLTSYLNITGTVYKNGISGACFSGGTAGNLKKFETMLEEMGGSILDKSKIASIIVAGGFNDRGMSEASILNAISSFADYAKLNYPNAEIYLAKIGHTRDYTTTDIGVTGGYIYNLRTVLPAYSKCAMYGIRFLTGCENVMHKLSYFQSDLVHPNEEGSKAIAVAIANAIKHGHYHFSDYGEASNLVSSGIASGITNSQQYTYQEGENVYYQLNGTFFLSATNIVAGTEYEIGTLSGGYGGGDIQFAPSFNITLRTNASYIPCKVTFKQSKLYITPLASASGVTQITIDKCLFQFNCMKF